MTPTSAVRAVFMALVFAYAGKLVVGRAALFSEQYALAAQEVQHQREVAQHCDENHKTGDLLADPCNVARRESGRWPWWDALGRTAERTYLCIEAPCPNPLTAVFNSLPATLVAGAVMLVMFSYVLSGMSAACARALALRAINNTSVDDWMSVRNPRDQIAWPPVQMPSPWDNKRAPTYARAPTDAEDTDTDEYGQRGRRRR